MNAVISNSHRGAHLDFDSRICSSMYGCAAVQQHSIYFTLHQTCDVRRQSPRREMPAVKQPARRYGIPTAAG